MADLSARLLGGLTVNVQRVSGLKNVAKFGKNSPQVSIAVNQDKKYTRTVEDGGNDVEFNESLFFNVDAMPSDIVHIKVKHDSKFVDSTIGIFSMSLGEFVKHQRRKLKFQIVDEDDFKPRGMIELVPEYHGTNEPPMPILSPTTAQQQQRASVILPQVPAPVPAAVAAAPVVAPQPSTPVHSTPVVPVSPVQPQQSVQVEPQPVQVQVQAPVQAAEQPLPPVSPGAVEPSAPPVEPATIPQPYSPPAVQFAPGESMEGVEGMQLGSPMQQQQQQSGSPANQQLSPQSQQSPMSQHSQPMSPHMQMHAQPISPQQQQQQQQQPPSPHQPQMHIQPQMQPQMQQPQMKPQMAPQMQMQPQALSPQAQYAPPAYASPGAPHMSVAPPVVGPAVYGSNVAATGYPGQPQPQAHFAPPVMQQQQQPQMGYRSPVSMQQPQPPALFMPGQPYGSQPQQIYGSQPQQQQPFGSQPYGSQPQQPYGSQAQQHPTITYHPPPPVMAPAVGHGSMQMAPPYSPPQQQQPMQFASQPGGPYITQQQQPQQRHAGVGPAGTFGAPYGSHAFVSSPTSMAMPAAPVATAAVGAVQPSSQRFTDTDYLGQRAPASRIIAVHVWADAQALYGVQLVYAVAGQRLDGPVVGRMAGPMRALTLVEGENLCGLAGRMGPVVLEALSFTTTRGGTTRFGAGNASPFAGAMQPVGREWSIPIAAGTRILGLHGSFNQQGITSLGAITTNAP